MRARGRLDYASSCVGHAVEAGHVTSVSISPGHDGTAKVDGTLQRQCLRNITEWRTIDITIDHDQWPGRQSIR